MNLVGGIDFKKIGINLWLAPQISEHCPVKMDGKLIIDIIWFKRPGIASALIPNEGIVQEWITSLDDAIILIGVFVGRIMELEVVNNRENLFFFKKASFSSFINISYLQYHCIPVVLIDKEGEGPSSIK